MKSLVKFHYISVLLLILSAPYVLSAQPGIRYEKLLQMQADQGARNILDTIKFHMDNYIRSHDQLRDLIQPGEVNYDSLTVKFPSKIQINQPIRKLGTEKRYYPPVNRTYYGIKIRTFTNVYPDQLNKTMGYVWHFADVGISWNHWNPGLKGDDNWEFQKKLASIVRESSKELDGLDRSLMEHYMRTVPKRMEVMEGNRYLEMFLEAPSDSLIRSFNVYLNKRFKDSLNVSKDYRYAWILDDSAVISPPFISLAVMAYSSLDIPFIDVKDSTLLRSVILNSDLIPAGIHTVRLLLYFNFDSWWDERQTIIDGPRVYRKNKHAWTGRIISKEYTIYKGQEKGVRLIE